MVSSTTKLMARSSSRRMAIPPCVAGQMDTSTCKLNKTIITPNSTARSGPHTMGHMMDGEGTAFEPKAIMRVLIPISIAGWLLFGVICILCINGKGKLGRWVPKCSHGVVAGDTACVAVEEGDSGGEAFFGWGKEGGEDAAAETGCGGRSLKEVGIVCHHLFSATSTHDPLRSLNLNPDSTFENLCADSASSSDTARHDTGRRIDCLPAAVARWEFVDLIDSWTPSSRLTTTRATEGGVAPGSTSLSLGVAELSFGRESRTEQTKRRLAHRLLYSFALLNISPSTPFYLEYNIRVALFTMASDSEVDAPRVNGTVEDAVLGGLDPSTPQEHETGAHPLSQITLPSTEMPGSPIDANQSFKTEVMDDRPAITVIPSSLTPPPSTQVAASNGASRRTYSNSQQSALFSPPATILNTMRERDIESDYTPPAPHRVLEASADELRAMLQTCIAENQKLKMEAAHHKLQYNLLSLQADEESKRAAVEHDMVRREVDALRMAEHSRQAKRELSTVSESIQNKYLQMKMWYESAMEENEALSRRVKLAKKVIQQKEEETMTLAEEREMLLNRIRENREHFHMLCSPGGIFHNALTPKQVITSTPQQQQQQHRTTSRALHREETDGREHGLSALLEAMSQSQSQENNAATMAATNNNSAPSTPMVMARPASRLVRRHQRNAQSMSSLPTTPSSRLRGDNSGLLPSVNLVAQTEPRSRYSQRRFVPTTPPSQRQSRRRRRESTISADDNEELARQAIESVKAVQSLSTQDAPEGVPLSSQEDNEQVQDSQASQAAAEMLRRHPGQGYKAPSSRDGTAGPAEKSAAMHAKLFAGSKTATGAEKRKLTAEGEAGADDMESPQKKLRTGGAASESRRVGLGIQYGQ
ncbi:hypothetical protein Trihar35433_3303 [Trichoderma harzianum]|nr:hypothetical protein Trihar35433_3303 [Trichoderma harzianum]